MGWSLEGNFKVEVLPMDAYHSLLGRPWLFDKYAIHDGKNSTYPFKLKG